MSDRDLVRAGLDQNLRKVAVVLGLEPHGGLIRLHLADDVPGAEAAAHFHFPAGNRARLHRGRKRRQAHHGVWRIAREGPEHRKPRSAAPSDIRFAKQAKTSTGSRRNPQERHSQPKRQKTISSDPTADESTPRHPRAAVKCRTIRRTALFQGPLRVSAHGNVKYTRALRECGAAEAPKKREAAPRLWNVAPRTFRRSTPSLRAARPHEEHTLRRRDRSPESAARSALAKRTFCSRRKMRARRGKSSLFCPAMGRYHFCLCSLVRWFDHSN
eukprot:scaffold1199_cov265-Pinguiococcus_pyrenoidosus.AAC.21